MLACNVGKTDKIIRVIIGVVILGLGYYFHSWLGIIGIVPILTAVFGRCGLYYPFKINTTKETETK
jgi:hypothetical protein